MKRMIFHMPLPLNPQAKSASGIRPVKMLEAFKSLGYEVFEITGYSAERKIKIDGLKNLINSGNIFDFVYSESSTMPTALTDQNHLPLNPCLDFHFFKLCKSHNIPIGLFYRDIYWKFPDYGKNLNWFKKNMAKAFYRFDLYNYEKYLEKIYLPSSTMAKYLPEISIDKIDELPPACDLQNFDIAFHMIKKPINILYIGGMGAHYQMHKLFEGVRNNKKFKLTVCTREAEWNNVKDSYKNLMANNIQIVHKSGEELQSLFNEANITSIFVKPTEYREFAVPVKLFEYLANSKPIIATKGTLVGDFVAKNNIGWVINYDSTEFSNLLIQLEKNTDEIFRKSQEMHELREQHTWVSRAKKVAKDLVI